MSAEKKYSHISIDIAPEEEESFHVGSSGVTKVETQQPSLEREEKNSSQFEKQSVENTAAPNREQSNNQEQSCEDAPLTEADLEADVPLPKLQVAILIALAIIVIVAVAYFVVFS